MPNVQHTLELRIIKLTLLIIFAIPATLAALYVIYSSVRIPSFRQRFQNQTLIILVCMVFLNIIFNITISISFFARGSLWPESEVLCDIWYALDYIFTGCTLWCKAIFTLERYLLVFHPQRLRSQRQKLLFHHIPLIGINLYLIIFYLIMQIVLRCTRKIEFDRHLCGTDCIDQLTALSTFNWLFNILLPVFITILGSLLLLLRVLWKRREMQRNLRYWSKNRKMIVQLLGIALIYTLVWMPLAIVSLVEISGNFDYAHGAVTEHLYFLTYLCAMMVPILALSLSPELQRPFRRCLRSGQVQDQSYTVGPISTY